MATLWGQFDITATARGMKAPRQTMRLLRWWVLLDLSGHKVLLAYRVLLGQKARLVLLVLKV
jgi:hypothetical protein